MNSVRRRHSVVCLPLHSDRAEGKSFASRSIRARSAFAAQRRTKKSKTLVFLSLFRLRSSRLHFSLGAANVCFCAGLRLISPCARLSRLRLAEHRMQAPSRQAHSSLAGTRERPTEMGQRIISWLLERERFFRPATRAANCALPPSLSLSSSIAGKNRFLGRPTAAAENGCVTMKI